ncbi:hypothetical protein LTR85_006264 [Meristemomyces frigidus]|nr:hypothetical protein LTR85_006264 [Meristemomyces frigidus]
MLNQLASWIPASVRIQVIVTGGARRDLEMLTSKLVVQPVVYRALESNRDVALVRGGGRLRVVFETTTPLRMDASSPMFPEEALVQRSDGSKYAPRASRETARWHLRPLTEQEASDGSFCGFFPTLVGIEGPKASS